LPEKTVPTHIGTVSFLDFGVKSVHPHTLKSRGVGVKILPRDKGGLKNTSRPEEGCSVYRENSRAAKHRQRCPGTENSPST